MVMKLLQTYLIILSILDLVWSAQKDASNDPKDCIRHAPVSLNELQKKALCTNQRKGSVGPANCATYAKTTLKSSISNDDIVELCQGVSSSEPIKCASALDTNTRKKVATRLCKLQL